MISVIGCPSKCQFRQVTCSDHHTARLIRDIHDHLRTFSRLTVFVCHIVIFHIMSDVPEMNGYGFTDIYFPQGRTKFFGKIAGITIRSVSSSETRHCDCRDFFPWHAKKIKGSGCHQQCQCGIKSAGDTDNSALAVSMFQTFLQSHCLNRQNLVTSFFPFFFSGRYKRFSRKSSGQSGFFFLQCKYNFLITGRICRRISCHFPSLGYKTPDIQITVDCLIDKTFCLF